MSRVEAPFSNARIAGSHIRNRGARLARHPSVLLKFAEKDL
jgi:hypothetical protein